MYGVTGAMFNHLGLFPRLQIQPVDPTAVASSGMSNFPDADALAAQVAETIQKEVGSARVELQKDSRAEFTNEISFEVKNNGLQHVVYIDPVTHESWVGTMPKNDEDPQPLLPSIRNVKLTPDPQETAHKAAAKLLEQAGLLNGKDPQPFGWTKLNFLASVDGEPARITYVLKDGHVDINRFTATTACLCDTFCCGCILRTVSRRHGTVDRSGRWLWIRWRLRWSSGESAASSCGGRSSGLDGSVRSSSGSASSPRQSWSWG